MFMGILEPKISARRIKNLSRKLGFNNLYFEKEVNHHIAVMWKEEVDLTLFKSDDQVLSFLGTINSNGQAFCISIVYALCSKIARRRIWDGLLDLNSQIQVPWMVGGDFNVISSWEEKRGGRKLDDGSMMEFNSFLIQSGLVDLSATNVGLSWTNNQQGNCRIYKKLDRILVNSETLLKVPNIRFSYLPRIQSDHMPLLLSFGNMESKSGGFKFMRMWTDHDNFIQLVKDCWNSQEHVNGLLNLHLKLKFLKKQLIGWNRNVFGNVDIRIESLTASISSLDDKLTTKWTEEIFRDLQEEKKELLKWEERKFGMLEDKARLNWVKGGDRNSNIFHAAIRDRTRRNRINLKLEDGSYSDDPKIIGVLATGYFTDLFQWSRYIQDHSLFDCIPRIISDNDNADPV